MIRTPARPSASMTMRPRLRRSPRISVARIAVHTGMVNSIAKTVARGSIAIAYTHAYWPPRCSTLRNTCSPSRRVRSLLKPRRGRTASTMRSETRLRRARISKLPMEWSSSRTETAMSENEISAPPIHKAPRSAADLPDKSTTRREVAALEQARGAVAEHEPPERRPDVEDRDIGDGHEEGHQRAEREAVPEAHRERGLQHAQHRKARERRDEGLGRGEHKAGEEGREQAEGERKQTDEDPCGIVTAPVSGRRDDRVNGAGQAGRDRADEGRDDRTGAAGSGHRVDGRRVSGRAQHRDPLPVLHDEHGDRERHDQLDHRAPGKCRRVEIQVRQRDGLRRGLESADHGYRDHADRERADEGRNEPREPLRGPYRQETSHHRRRDP